MWRVSQNQYLLGRKQPAVNHEIWSSHHLPRKSGFMVSPLPHIVNHEPILHALSLPSSLVRWSQLGGLLQFLGRTIRPFNVTAVLLQERHNRCADPLELLHLPGPCRKRAKHPHMGPPCPPACWSPAVGETVLSPLHSQTARFNRERVGRGTLNLEYFTETEVIFYPAYLMTCGYSWFPSSIRTEDKGEFPLWF